MGKKTSKTTSTVAPPTWAVPIIQGGANSLMNTYNQNQGGLQNLASNITGSVVPGIQHQIDQQGQQLQPGYNYVNATLGSNPGNNNPANSYLQGTLNSGFANSNPANSFLQGTLGSNYLSANPANGQLSAYANGKYLNSNNAAVQQLAQFAGQQAGNAVNSAFSTAGRTGSGYNVTDLSRGVTQAELQPMLQNNQFEQGLQQQALGQLSSNYNTAAAQQTQNANLLGSNYNTALGVQSQNAGQLGSNYNAGLGAQNQAASLLPSYSNSQFTGYTPLLAGAQLGGQLPYYGSGTVGQIGSLLGNYGSTTAQQPGGWGSGLLGAASNMFSFAPISLSDRRLKTNIVKVGEASDGLGLYEWNWKSDPNGRRMVGVIADEVKVLRPHAYVPNYRHGYDGVNYAALGSMA